MYVTRATRYVNIVDPLIRSDSLILDIGCGYGTIGKEARSRGGHLVSIDNSISVLRDPSSEVLEDRICASANYLPLQSGTFDFIMAFSLLEHVSDIPKVLDEVREVLTDEGYFAVQLPNPQWFVEPHTKFPLLFLLPGKAKDVIRRRVMSAYTNFGLTLKSFERITSSRFTTVSRVPIHNVVFFAPWPSGWMIIQRKKGVLNRRPLREA